MTPNEIAAVVRKRAAQSRGFHRDAEAGWEEVKRDYLDRAKAVWPPLRPVAQKRGYDATRLEYLSCLADGQPIATAVAAGKGACIFPVAQ